MGYPKLVGRCASGLAATGALLLLGACGGSDDDGETTPSPQPGGCQEAHLVAGACAGVPETAVCDGAVCNEGVGCAKTIEAKSDAELASAASGATAGTCIAIHPGAYGAITLPGGVSLLGRAASDVKIAGVVMGAGSGAWLRGVTVGGEGLRLDKAVDVHVDAVRVAASSADGIVAGAGSSIAVKRSAIEGSTRYGFFASDVKSASLEATLVTGSRGPGVWAECTAGCECTTQPTLDLEHAILRDNRIVGLSLKGVTATITASIVADNAVSEEHNLTPGGGISAAECSSLKARGLTVSGNSSYGLLFDASSADLGAPGEESGIIINDNVLGLWVQKTEQAVFTNCQLSNNGGVGVGISQTAKGIIINDFVIKGTTEESLPVIEDGMIGGAQNVGDGLAWLDASEVAINGLTMEGNARASVIIDGPVGVGSSLAGLKLSGGDEAKGVLQQNFSGSGALEVSGGTVSQVAGQTFPVAASPSAPAGL